MKTVEFALVYRAGRPFVRGPYCTRCGRRVGGVPPSCCECPVQTPGDYGRRSRLRRAQTSAPDSR